MSSSGIATSETINSTTEWKSGSLTNVTVTKGNLKLGYVNKTANNVDAGKYANVSGGDTSYGEYITKVEIKDISHSTGDNGGYLDATNIKSSSLKPGHTYKISVRFHTGGYGEYATVAFDWNDNEDLSDDNVYKIGHCSTNGCVVSEQITVPKDINMGESTIMRVIGAYSSYHMDPTTDTTYNEQEDYSVYLPEYKSSGTHSTGWINTGRKASWHNLTYRTESINTDTQISIDIEVSNDKSNVLDSTSYLLADGKNTIDLTGLENAQYIKITADLGTSNSSDTPKLDFYEINHKLINITSTDVKNYDDKHKSNISAIAEHPSGDASFSSCKVYYKPNYKDNYKKLGSATLKNVSGPQKKACNASLSKSLDHIGYGSTETDKIDYYFIFNDTDSVKRKSAKKSLTLPNSEPAINLTDQTTSSSSH
ncbi:MAG: GEVED domain-containing protein, partial [Candidatus Nanohalobium sp.]